MTTQSNQLLTVTLSTGETVLAKSEVDPFSKFGTKVLSPLRYGNLSAAQKKLDLIQSLISPARSASIVKLDERFLVTIRQSSSRVVEHMASGYQQLAAGAMSKAAQTIGGFRQSESARRQGPGRIFATTSGIRSNPRNRHNHNHKDQTDKPYHFGV